MTDELPAPNPFYLRDPYREFLQREGVPVYENILSLDLLTLELEPWPRMGGLGAYVHIAGRGDFVSSYVAEIPPGGHLEPEKHLYDELICVLSGRGGGFVLATSPFDSQAIDQPCSAPHVAIVCLAASP